MSAEASSYARPATRVGSRRLSIEPLATATVPSAITPPPSRTKLSSVQAGLRGSARSAALQAWGGFAGVVLTECVLALSASRTALLLPESTRPVPSSMAGSFGHYGMDLGLGGMIAVLGLMFLSYAAMVRGAHRLSARPVLIGIACLTTLVLLGPPMLSTDVFSYVAYGRMGAIYGANPYVYGPSAIA